MSVPAGSWRKSRLRWRPPGAEPVPRRNSTTRLRIVTSAAPISSANSRTRVMTCTWLRLTTSTTTSATTAMISQSGEKFDAEVLQQLREEQPDLDRRARADREVGEEQHPAGDEPGARPEGDADRRVDRAGVRDVAGQLDEAVGDERDRDQREDERPGRAAAEDAGRADAEQRHHADRADQADRERRGVGDLQLAVQRVGRRLRRAAGLGRGHGGPSVAEQGWSWATVATAAPCAGDKRQPPTRAIGPT